MLQLCFSSPLSTRHETGPRLISLPVVTVASFVCKLPTSLTSLSLCSRRTLMSLVSCLTCSWSAITELFHIWSSTLGPGVCAQSLVGTLNEYTQPALSPAVLWPCVTHTTERTRLKDRITFTILNPTTLTWRQPEYTVSDSMLTAHCLSVTATNEGEHWSNRKWRLRRQRANYCCHRMVNLTVCCRK